jgi:hypothetical protein
MAAHQGPGAEQTGPGDLPVLDEPVAAAPIEPAPIEPAPVRPVRRARPRRSAPRPRRLLADYLDQARAELRRAEEAGERIDPSPAWCRRATGCSAGTSVKLAAALRVPDMTTSTERQEAA